MSRFDPIETFDGLEEELGAASSRRTMIRRLGSLGLVAAGGLALAPLAAEAKGKKKPKKHRGGDGHGGDGSDGGNDGGNDGQGPGDGAAGRQALTGPRSHQRYVVRAVSFKCIDESGVDFTGSDEPVWIFTANAGGVVTTTRSPEFGDVDSGDTRNFAMANSNLIWPSRTGTAGAPGPIGLAIQVWDVDQGNADTIATRTRQVLAAASFAPKVGQWVAAIPSFVPGLVGDFLGDDLLGSRQFFYSAETLASRLPRVGSTFTQQARFTEVCTICNPADYDLFLQVKRVA